MVGRKAKVKLLVLGKSQASRKRLWGNQDEDKVQLSLINTYLTYVLCICQISLENKFCSGHTIVQFLFSYTLDLWSSDAQSRTTR